MRVDAETACTLNSHINRFVARRAELCQPSCAVINKHVCTLGQAEVFNMLHRNVVAGSYGATQQLMDWHACVCKRATTSSKSCLEHYHTSEPTRARLKNSFTYSWRARFPEPAPPSLCSRVLPAATMARRHEMCVLVMGGTLLRVGGKWSENGDFSLPFGANIQPLWRGCHL